MATDVGSIYLEVFADTKALKAQVRKAAKDAGKEFGQEWGDEAEKSMAPSLSRIGQQTLRKFKVTGKQSAGEFATAWNDGIKKEQIDFEIHLDEEIRRVGKSNAWSELFEQFDSLDEATERINTRLRELGKGGTFAKQTGVSIVTLREQMEAAAKAFKNFGVQQEESNRLADANRKAVQRQKEELKGWLIILDEAHREDAEWSRLKKKADKEAADSFEASMQRQKQELQGWRIILEEASRENDAFNQRRKKQQQDWNLILTEAIRMNQEFDKSQREMRKTLNDNAIRDAASDTAVLNTEYKNLNASLNESNKALDVFRKRARNRRQRNEVNGLAMEYDRLGKQITGVMDEHRIATANMVRGSKEHKKAIQDTNDTLRLLGGDLRALGDRKLKVKVDVDTPGKTAMTVKGAVDGLAYSRGFQSTSAGWMTSLKQQFNMLAQAFPAAVTILFKPLGLIIGAALAAPLAAAVSSVAGMLVAVLSSIAVAAGGAALALAGVGVAGVYAATLAFKAFDEFKESFPETQAAIDSLKDSFENVDVPRFAKEWSESIKDFAQTLGDSLRFDTVAENLGKATAKVTEAFTGVLKSPAWTDFVHAIEGPFSRALGNFGVGLADLSSVLLQWMTAAAPLAEHLGEMFGDWAENLKEALGTKEGQDALANFFRQAEDALDVIVPLIGDLGSALGNVFTAGADAGTGMLAVFGELARDFNAWTESIEGKNALATWFEQARSVFDHLIPLIGIIGDSISAMVTPNAIRLLNDFIDTLGIIIPVFTELLTVVGDLGLLNLFADIIGYIAQAIRPLLPFLDALAQAFYTIASTLLDALGPILVIIGDLFGDLLDQITPLIGPLTEIIAAFITLDPARLTNGFAALNDTLAPALAGIVDWVGRVVDVLLEMIPSFIVALANMIPVAVTGFTNLLGALVEAVADTIPLIVEEIAEVTPKILDAIRDMTPKLVLAGRDTFKALSQAVKDTLPKILESIQDILPEVIGVLKDAVPDLIDAAKEFFGGMQEALEAVLPELLAAWQEVGPALVEAAVEIGAMMATVGFEIFQALVEAAAEILPIVVETVMTGLEGMIEGLATLLPMLIQGAITLFIGFVDAIALIIPPVIKAIGDMMPEIMEALKIAMPLLLETAITVFTMIAQGVTENTQLIQDTIALLMPAINDAFILMMPDLIEASTVLFTEIAKGVALATPQIIIAVSRTMPAIIAEMVRLTPQLITAAGTMFGAIAQGVPLATGAILGALARMLTQLAGAAVAEGVKFVQVGVSIVEGIIRGVGMAAGRLARTVADAAGNAWTAAKNAIGMGSPAKKFIPIGESTMQGFQVGVQRATPQMLSAIRAASGSAISEFAPTFSASSFGVNPARSSGLSTQGSPVRAGATVAEGAIQIITPVKDPRLVANMVLDDIVTRL